MPPATKQEQEALLGPGRSTSLPLSANALRVLAQRYLVPGKDGLPSETPEQMFRRVADGLAAIERKCYGASPEQERSWATRFYAELSSLRFTPAGRTLTNVGAGTPVVANCIVLHFKDDMRSIFQTLQDAALLQQAGSGLGFPFHLLRPAGTITVRSRGTSSGPVSFLHVFDAAFGVIKQQNRHGANMAVMSIEHPDILDFIHAKDREGDLHNFNISVGLTDRFMRAVAEDDPNPWMCQWNGKPMTPREVVRDRQTWGIQSIKDVTLTARQIFDVIVDSAWKTGEPGCVFLDTVNATNPLPKLGRIEACNPCGEI